MITRPAPVVIRVCGDPASRGSVVLKFDPDAAWQFLMEIHHDSQGGQVQTWEIQRRALGRALLMGARGVFGIEGSCFSAALSEKMVRMKFTSWENPDHYAFVDIRRYDLQTFMQETVDLVDFDQEDSIIEHALDQALERIISDE